MIHLKYQHRLVAPSTDYCFKSMHKTPKQKKQTYQFDKEQKVPKISEKQTEQNKNKNSNLEQI